MIWDEELYQRNRTAIDWAWLEACSDERYQTESSQTERVGEMLVALGIGNARRAEKLAISYSTTGGAARSGKRVLVQQGVLSLEQAPTEQMWFHPLYQREVPWIRHYVRLTGAGWEYLHELRKHAEQDEERKAMEDA